MILLPEYVTLPETWYEGLETRFITASSSEANHGLVLPALWHDFFEKAHNIRSNDPQGAFYGLCDSPESRGQERYHLEEAFYLAAARVDEASPAKAGMVRWKTAAGLYAKFEYIGLVDNLGEAIRQIREEWLPNSEFRKHTGPDIERYDHRFDPMSEDSVLEIFISIR